MAPMRQSHHSRAAATGRHRLGPRNPGPMVFVGGHPAPHKGSPSPRTITYIPKSIVHPGSARNNQGCFTSPRWIPWGVSAGCGQDVGRKLLTIPLQRPPRIPGFMKCSSLPRTPCHAGWCTMHLKPAMLLLPEIGRSSDIPDRPHRNLGTLGKVLHGEFRDAASDHDRGGGCRRGCVEYMYHARAAQ